MTAVLYERYRQELISRCKDWPVEAVNQDVFDLMRENVVDQNYYNWFMRYVQMSCYALNEDLSVARLRIKLVNEDELEFVVQGSAQEAYFTGRIVTHQIALIYNQIPVLRGLSDGDTTTTDS